MEYTLLIAGIQAILAAMGVWQKERDYNKAQVAYRETFSETLKAPDIQARAADLQQVLPPHIAKSFRDNLDTCWERFGNCIKGKSTDEELVPCEETNRECICSNLRAVVRNNGSLPPDLYPLWMQFGCGPKPPTSISPAFKLSTNFETNEGSHVAMPQYQKLNS